MLYAVRVVGDMNPTLALHHADKSDGLLPLAAFGPFQDPPPIKHQLPTPLLEAVGWVAS